jgi:hypothetical protein
VYNLTYPPGIQWVRVPAGMDMGKFYTHRYGYGHCTIDYICMGMVLIYPAHTLPIAILSLGPVGIVFIFGSVPPHLACSVVCSSVWFGAQPDGLVSLLCVVTHRQCPNLCVWCCKKKLCVLGRSNPQSSIPHQGYIGLRACIIVIS